MHPTIEYMKDDNGLKFVQNLQGIVGLSQHPLSYYFLNYLNKTLANRIRPRHFSWSVINW